MVAGGRSGQGGTTTGKPCRIGEHPGEVPDPASDLPCPVAQAQSLFEKITETRCGRFGVPPLGGFRAAPPKGGTPNRILKQALRDAVTPAGVIVIFCAVSRRSPPHQPPATSGYPLTTLRVDRVRMSKVQRRYLIAQISSNSGFVIMAVPQPLEKARRSNSGRSSPAAEGWGRPAPEAAPRPAVSFQSAVAPVRGGGAACRRGFGLDRILSRLLPWFLLNGQKPHSLILARVSQWSGARGEGRTLNLRLRRPTLYPIELLAQTETTVGQTVRGSNLFLKVSTSARWGQSRRTSPGCLL